MTLPFLLKIEQMKIKAKNPKVASMKLCVPIDGNIDVDSEGVAEVSAKCAAELVKNTSDWGFLKKGSATTSEGAEDDDEEEDEDESESAAADREKFVKSLKGKKLPELQALATELALPEEEWKELTVKLLTAYLIGKYDSVSEDDDEEEDEDEGAK